MSEAPVGQYLNERELQFVTFMHQCYSLTGSLMTKEAAFEDWGIDPKQYDKYMGRENIKAALIERGIDLDKYVPKAAKNAWQVEALTPIQLLVAEAMLDAIDTRSQKKKLQDLGIATTTYNTWLRDPVFRNYVQQRAEAALGDNQHEAHLALIDKMRMGDIKAIEYYNKLTGRFNPTPEAANKESVSVHVEQLLVNIIEIITEEVDDPATAIRISERFKTLMTARTVAGQLLESTNEIVEPEVMPARILSPKLQALVDKGEGVNS